MSFGILLLALSGTALAKTITYEWDVGWVNAAPDGYERPVIGINGQWPPPILEADLDDTINIKVTNCLGNETTSIHWHGQWQQGTPNMDGAADVTQCTIPPGSSFQYTFTANPAGTFWYHSHSSGQYPDGIRAPMIVHDRIKEALYGVSAQYPLTMSDWYHEQMPKLVHDYLLSNDTASMPTPDSSLTNDTTQPVTIPMKAHQKVLLRLINMSAMTPYHIQFDGHQMSVVAIDGVSIIPTLAESLLITPAQRYDVILTGIGNASKNYAWITKTDGYDLQNNGILSYSDSYADPSPMTSPSTWNFPDDFFFKPLDLQPILAPVTKRVTLDINTVTTNAGQRSITLGNDSYIGPQVPSLYTTVSESSSNTDPEIYGQVNAFVVNSGDIVELIVNNYADGAHPMHLHGHVFQLVQRSSDIFSGSEAGFPLIPMKRDTVGMLAGGSIVIRFKADNPGVWLFHCHIDWHLDAGMSATVIEAPSKLAISSIPQDEIAVCTANDQPTTGNCAGSQDLSNTTICHIEDPNPWG
ncbi:multicopper oxidase [Saccharata proteae CBS 121410]|uniref:Multicopper oxidase n=1 Tax=Saccharata proteae CBS 121410 TaxID=1314787 RepID=A0A9P4I2N7_9PEZI|nr:multicopper oxidase [Saccharata proteae CBS 121410]